MQYGLGVNKCEEINGESSVKRKLGMKISITQLTTILVVGVLLSRVNLLLNQSDSHGIAPFGIAYLMAVVTKNNKINNAVAAVGTIIGYMTINNLLTDGYVYLVAVGIIAVCYTFMPIKKKSQKELVGVIIILLSFFGYGVVVNKYELGVNLTLCLIQTLVIMPVYYVIKYALNSLGEISTSYFFNSEEIISIGIFLCLLVAGIGDINLIDYSIRNIIALMLVLSVAYIGGANYGAMMGVSMGIILGVASNDMMFCVGFFGVGGLIVGIFKDTGKIFSILAGIIIYFALGLYSNALTLKLIVEVLGSSVLFLCVPKSVYKSIEVEINPERKRQSLSETKLNEIKEEFTLKLKELTGVLTTVANSLNTNYDNENLLINNKASALVENLADRSCSKCENMSLCWKKNFNQTYNSFQLLIQSYQDGKIAIPKDLEKRCVKNFTILKNTEDIINNYEVDEMLKEKLVEGRGILSEHITNISSTLDDLLSDFKREVTIDNDLAKVIKRELLKNSIDYKGVLCYTDTSGRIKIRVSMNKCEDTDYYNNTLVPMLSNAVKIKLCIADDGCNINPHTNECVIVMEEIPKYYMVSYGAVEPKNGEDETGDNYSFGKTSNGCYMTVLSDGMGSGPEAAQESKTTVDLVEKFIEAGFDEDITVNTVNSIMAMRFAEDEKYATLDLSRVNLYNGDAKFVKIGAAPTFIKRGREVKVINSKNLPFGLVDEVEVEILKEKLKPGDILVSVSDGVLNIDKLESGKFIWLEEYLKNINTDPRELSELILNKAKELSNGAIEDDMMAVVSKIYLAN